MSNEWWAWTGAGHGLVVAELGTSGASDRDAALCSLNRLGPDAGGDGIGLVRGLRLDRRQAAQFLLDDESVLPLRD